MKNILLLLALIGIFEANAQTTQSRGLTNALQNSASRVISKVKKYNNIQSITVNSFIDDDGGVSTFGRFLSKSYSTELAMQPDSPPIVVGITVDDKPAKLTSQNGFITAIAVGTITKVGEEYFIHIIVQNDENNQILAADAFVITGKDYEGMFNSTGGQPVKNPLADPSNTNTKNTPTNKDCEVNNTCTICFTNNLPITGDQPLEMSVYIGDYYSGNRKNIYIPVGQERCVYKLKANEEYTYDSLYYPKNAIQPIKILSYVVMSTCEVRKIVLQ
jgi:hypothetical protein